MQTFWQYFFGVTLFITSVLLILLVLVQRGRGGGLAGALGGPGGQSAFGTKAGDTFTWVTAGAALVWGLLAVSAIKLISNEGGGFGDISGSNIPARPAAEAPFGDESARPNIPARGDAPLSGAVPAPSKTPAATPSGEQADEQ